MPFPAGPACATVLTSLRDGRARPRPLLHDPVDARDAGRERTRQWRRCVEKCRTRKARMFCCTPCGREILNATPEEGDCLGEFRPFVVRGRNRDRWGSRSSRPSRGCDARCDLLRVGGAMGNARGEPGGFLGPGRPDGDPSGGERDSRRPRGAHDWILWRPDHVQHVQPRRVDACPHGPCTARRRIRGRERTAGDARGRGRNDNRILGDASRRGLRARAGTWCTRIHAT